MKKYVIVIEKGGHNYSAFSPDVEGCTTTGDTIEHTLENMKEALAGHIELLDEIPEPKGLLHHLNAGEFETDKLEGNYFITYAQHGTKKTIQS